uniref:Uncharacterized protein n=1 Tax=Arundo donax TaxID=35708 RepID=A0A0A9GZA8_ARUDO
MAARTAADSGAEVAAAAAGHAPAGIEDGGRGRKQREASSWRAA